MILTKPRTCRECGKPLDPDRKANTEFCATACRIAWRHRRMSRGADGAGENFDRDLRHGHRLFRVDWR